MEKVNVLIKKEEIQKRVEEIAAKISEDYKNEEIIMICVLKGAVCFAIDLAKKIKNENLILDFIKVSSYGTNQRETTGKINFKLDVSEDIENKNVIIVEDIIDSGITLNYLYDHLKTKNPKTIKICVLLDKKSRRIKPIDIDYTGFEIEDKFIFGYGLDYDEKYRNLEDIVYIG